MLFPAPAGAILNTAAGGWLPGEQEVMRRGTIGHIGLTKTSTGDRRAVICELREDKTTQYTFKDTRVFVQRGG